jgi:hypothetical protein
MPYASDRDRNPHDLELRDPAFPVPPLNLFLAAGPDRGILDLCWDNPANLSANAQFTICGVNIYRSFDSEFGPFERLTEFPVGSIFFRDQTDNALVVDEVVQDYQKLVWGESSAAEAEGERFIFKTMRNPIVISGSQAVPDQDIRSVYVTVDGVPAKIRRVVGQTGEIEIDVREYANVATQTMDTFPKPGPDSEVLVTYRYNRTLIRTDLATRVFYRVTTVAAPQGMNPRDLQPQDLVETPLERAAVTNIREAEKLDWIWTEAVRRNRWILQQGGERVRVFLRKTMGEPCYCCQSLTHKHPQNDCLNCYGTGIVGGFEGPYAIVIAPDDADRRIAHNPHGRNLEHTYEVWTSPSPLLSQRDFLVKINGERYSVGPVRMPSNRGMLLQQHFNIGYFDEKDIRYRVPLDGLRGLYANYAAPLIPPHLDAAGRTDKPNIPDERELRGNTKTWENITY